MCSADVNIALARPRSTPCRSARWGTKLCRAAEPAESTTVPSPASSTTCQMRSASKATRRASGATANPLRRSARALARVKPRACTIRPAASPPAAAPHAPETTTTPASAALPVLVKTNHGIATVIITLPLSETAFATTRQVSGERTGVVGAVVGGSAIWSTHQESWRSSAASNTYFRPIDTANALMQWLAVRMHES